MHGNDKHQIQDGGYTGHKGELGPGTGQGYTGVYKHICHVLFLTYLKQKWQNAEPCQRGNSYMGVSAFYVRNKL